MSETNLRKVAEWRVHDPMMTWPEHNNYHRRTLLNNCLFDYSCLRCHLEEVATEMAEDAAKREESKKKVPHVLKETVTE